MAYVTTPRWLSPASRRIVVIVITAAAALMLLTSILVARASAEVAPDLVRNVDGDACVYSTNQYDSFGVAGVTRVVPRGDGVTNYTETINLPNGASILLTSPPNRSHVTFAVTGDASVVGGFIFNRTDQKLGNLYDYRPGSVTEGILEPPPRDQGNDKKVTLCLGLNASVSMTATLNGVSVPVAAGDPHPVVTYPLTWVFTIENTGEVDIDGIIVDENGNPVVCEPVPGTIAPGATATCTVVQNAPPGSPGDPEMETAFTVTGFGAGREVSDTIESIEFYVGFDCGAIVRANGPNKTGDGPDVGFWVGPVSDPELECGTAVEVNAYLSETDKTQVTEIVAPEGYPFIGTGVVTVNWDAIPRDDDPLVRTVQEVTGGTDVIEQCAVIIPIQVATTGGDYELVPISTDPEPIYPLYPDATDFDGNGEYSENESICLIQQFNYQVDVSGEVYMQLQEVYYVWNDPILIRPR